MAEYHQRVCVTGPLEDRGNFRSAFGRGELGFQDFTVNHDADSFGRVFAGTVSLRPSHRLLASMLILADKLD